MGTTSLTITKSSSLLGLAEMIGFAEGTSTVFSLSAATISFGISTDAFSNVFLTSSMSRIALLPLVFATPLAVSSATLVSSVVISLSVVLMPVSTSPVKSNDSSASFLAAASRAAISAFEGRPLFLLTTGAGSSLLAEFCFST